MWGDRGEVNAVQGAYFPLSDRSEAGATSVGKLQCTQLAEVDLKE